MKARNVLQAEEGWEERKDGVSIMSGEGSNRREEKKSSASGGRERAWGKLSVCQEKRKNTCSRLKAWPPR